MFDYDCTSPQELLKTPQLLGVFFIFLLSLWLITEHYITARFYKLTFKVFITILGLIYLFFLTPLGQPLLNKTWSLFSDDFSITQLDQNVKDRLLAERSNPAGYIIYFGYTFCPDICPTSLYTINQLFKKFQAEHKPTPTLYFITLDPARDTAERMIEYLKFFNESFLFLPLNENEKNQFVKNFNVKYKVNKHNNDDKNYVIDHSASIYFLDSMAIPLFAVKHGTSNEEIFKLFLNQTQTGDSK